MNSVGSGGSVDFLILATSCCFRIPSDSRPGAIAGAGSSMNTGAGNQTEEEIPLQEGCPPALFVYNYTASTLILGGLVVSILIYPIIYHGLLSIGVMLSNPLGTDLIDFPGSFYQSVMKAELNGFAKSADAVDLGSKQSGKGPRWWPGLSPR